MAEYIDRDAVCYQLEKQESIDGQPRAIRRARRIVANFSAADVRPVVKAKWQYKTMTVPGGKGQTYAKWSCTHCKGKSQYRTLYCPNCGAEMEDGS